MYINSNKEIGNEISELQKNFMCSTIFLPENIFQKQNKTRAKIRKIIKSF